MRNCAILMMMVMCVVVMGQETLDKEAPTIDTLSPEMPSTDGPKTKTDHFEGEKAKKREEMKNKMSFAKAVRHYPYVLFTYIDHFGWLRKDWEMVQNAKEYMAQLPVLNMLPNWYMNIIAWYCLIMPQVTSIMFLFAYIFWNVINPIFNVVPEGYNLLSGKVTEVREEDAIAHKVMEKRKQDKEAEKKAQADKKKN